MSGSGPKSSGVSTVATVQQDGPLQLLRPARALLGWLPDDRARLILVGNQQGIPPSDEQIERARAARAAVAARPADFDSSGVVTTAPPELDGHIATLRQHPVVAPLFNDGCQVSLVDLRRVCAVQPQVFTDSAEERVSSVDADDLLSIAAVSIPIPRETQPPAQYDPSRNVWMFSSPNPNLRIAGYLSTEVQPGVVGFGFMVGISTSYLMVGQLHGRYFLRDGYHRAVGFLQRGIFTVPAFTREYGPQESLGLPAGMLPEGAYFGPRPPCLPDYLDETVSALVNLPASEKMVVIQGLELTPAG